MLESVFGSLLGKVVYSVAGAVGLFGGLAVTGVLPVVGGNASDSVALDAVAVVETEYQELVVSPYVELPSVGGVVSQVTGVAELTETLPGIDGVIANDTAGDTGLNAFGLAGTLLNSVSGTVDAVVSSLPLLNQVIPGLPVVSGVEVAPTAATGPELVTDTLESVPSSVESADLPVADDVARTVGTLPLAGQLLRTAQRAVFGLLPEFLVLVE